MRLVFVVLVIPCLLAGSRWMPVVASEEIDWAPLVEAAWEGYKTNYVLCGDKCGDNLGLVFDPDRDYEAVSEAVGYGLLMAVMMDDRPTFDTIYDAAHEILLDNATGLFHWRADRAGRIVGRGSATDADTDIAAALIFAQRRVERLEWPQHSYRPYGLRAQALIEVIWNHEVSDGRYLKPGSLFGGDGRDIINLSYFSPAWYRLFNVFQDTDRWADVIDQGYMSLSMTQGALRGLAPDWSTAEGDPAWQYCDTIERPRGLCAYDMGYDAIRVPWRIGLDCLWFTDLRACDWSERSVDFLNSLPASHRALMYNMQGNPVVNYQDTAMVSMWLVSAVAGRDKILQENLEDQLYSLGGNVIQRGYWGTNPRSYYNQSLAWFAAALLSGDFRNIF